MLELERVVVVVVEGTKHSLIILIPDHNRRRHLCPRAHNKNSECLAFEMERDFRNNLLILAERAHLLYRWWLLWYTVLVAICSCAPLERPYRHRIIAVRIYD